MKLNYEKILNDANAIYAVEKLEKAGVSKNSYAYLAPEQIPQIQSDQVKAILQALIQELNLKFTFIDNRLGPRSRPGDIGPF